MINPNYSKFPEIEPINEKTMKQDNYLRNSDTFKKTLNKEFKDEKIVIKKPSIHKKNSSDKTNILTNVNTMKCGLILVMKMIFYFLIITDSV